MNEQITYFGSQLENKAFQSKGILKIIITLNWSIALGPFVYGILLLSHDLSFLYLIYGLNHIFCLLFVYLLSEVSSYGSNSYFKKVFKLLKFEEQQ